MNELLAAVEPFLSAAQEALPQVVPETTSFEVEGFNHLPTLSSVDSRVLVPPHTHLREIVTSADVSHSWAVPFFPQTMPLGGQSEAAGPSFMLGQGPLPGEASSAFSVDISQDEIWNSVEEEEKREWKALRSSREYKAAERHINLCERKISAIVEKATSLYKEGSLPINIDEEKDIGRGIDIYFSDLRLLEKNQQRLGHINRALEGVGNPHSKIWNKIKNQIESLR